MINQKKKSKSKFRLVFSQFSISSWMENVTSRTENSPARLGLITKVRTYLSLDQEKHVQISFLMEKACYHVQLPQRPNIDLQNKVFRLQQLESLFPINIIWAKKPSWYYCLSIQRYTVLKLELKPPTSLVPLIDSRMLWSPMTLLSTYLLPSSIYRTWIHSLQWF